MERTALLSAHLGPRVRPTIVDGPNGRMHTGWLVHESRMPVATRFLAGRPRSSPVAVVGLLFVPRFANQTERARRNGRAEPSRTEPSRLESSRAGTERRSARTHLIVSDASRVRHRVSACVNECVHQTASLRAVFFLLSDTFSFR